jgi:CelD/BcsL family acetyltransferase involved in cellulose biosynthesis/GNAT superfamily N-acetyltransferase
MKLRPDRSAALRKRPLDIEWHSGRAAADLLSSIGPQWTELCARCPWATGFQSFWFAKTWYNTYQPIYKALIGVGRDRANNLCGLLALAVAADGKLVACGAQDAEYASWIALPEASDDFLGGALAKLWRMFPSGSLEFRYVPPGAPLGWCSPRANAVVVPRPRPLMRLDAAVLDSSLRKKSNKSRLSRIRALGPVSLVQIEDRAELERYIGRISAYYDLRQGAAYGALPYHADPLKREFQLALMNEPGVAHVTVLKAGEEVVAAHLGVCSSDKVSLGVIAHAPASRRHSAGKLLLLQLGKTLSGQGYRYLDLTPGGDEYKERFSTEHDQTHIVSVSATRTRYWKSLVTAWLRFRLMPGFVLQLARQVRRQQLGPVSLCLRAARDLRRWIFRREELRVYRCDTALGGPTSDFAVNRIEDLLLYRPAGPLDPTAAEFLYQVYERLSNGDQVYTKVEGDRLIHCAWLGRRQAPGRDHSEGVGVAAEPMTLWDAYTHPDARGRGIHQASILQRLADAARLGAHSVLVSIPASNAVAIHNARKCGFQYRYSVRRRVMFGKETSGPGNTVHLDDVAESIGQA